MEKDAFLTVKISCLGLDPFFLDTGLLACQGAQIIQLGAANFAHLVDSDAFNKRRFEGEDAFNTHVLRHLAYGEALFFSMSADSDDNAAVLLDTFLVTFFDAVGDGHRVATFEGWVFLPGSEGLFGHFK